MSLLLSASLPSLRAKRDRRTWSPTALRVLLLVGCLASVAAAAWLGQPEGYLRADYELAVLLRGMAGIKACIAIAAVSVMFWRLGYAVPAPIATTYLISTWLMGGAAMLVWQLSFIPLAAVVFHVGEFAVLFAAWHDFQAGAQRSKMRSDA